MSFNEKFFSKAIIYTLAAFVILIISIIGVFFLFANTADLFNSYGFDYEKMAPSASADTWNLIFGLPLIFITSMIAILLASLGYQIAKNQDQRDAKEAAKSVADKYSELATCIMELHDSFKRVSIEYKHYYDVQRDRYLELERAGDGFAYNEYDPETGISSKTQEFEKEVNRVKKETRKAHYPDLIKAYENLQSRTNSLQTSLNKVFSDGDAMEILFSRGNSDRDETLSQIVEVKKAVEFCWRYVEFLKTLPMNKFYDEIALLTKRKEEFEYDGDIVLLSDPVERSIDNDYLIQNLWGFYLGHSVTLKELDNLEVKDKVLEIKPLGARSFTKLFDLIPEKDEFLKHFFKDFNSSKIEFISKEILEKVVRNELSLQLNPVDLNSYTLKVEDGPHQTNPDDLKCFLIQVLDKELNLRKLYLSSSY